MEIRGRLQPRYEFEANGDPFAPVHSSMYLRRARFDFQGHVMTEDLTYRLMPEMGRTTTLRDGWFDYRFDDALRVRVGQFQIPFGWERDSSSNRHQFMERSAANNEFQWPSGRDIGAQLHGTFGERFRYGIGGFSGQGRNAARSNSAGNQFSGRLTATVVGDYPGSEVLTEPVDGINVAVGTGGYYAFANDVRDWEYRYGEPPQVRADVLSATADAHLQWQRLSMHLSGYAQQVGSRTGAFATYWGLGATGQLGVLVVPERLFGALRLSDAAPWGYDDRRRQQKATVGMQLFQRRHAAKLQVEAGHRRVDDGGEVTASHLLQVQYQLLF